MSDKNESETMSAAKAKALLDAAPAGPYEALHPDDMPGRSVVVGGSERHPPYDAFVVGIDDKPRVALAELFAASPALAATVIAQATEIERLRGALLEIHGEFIHGSRKLYTTPDAALDSIRAAAANALGGAK